MNKYIFISLLGFFLLSNTISENELEQDKIKILQTQSFNYGESITLTCEENEEREGSLLSSELLFKLNFIKYEDNKDLTEYTITLNEVIKRKNMTWNQRTKVNIFFLTKVHGYFYGFYEGYGFFPFFYKTIDGGKTWEEKIMSENDYTELPSFSDNNFFMFDESNGILMEDNGKINMWDGNGSGDGYDYYQDSKLNYYITNDAWKSYEKLHLNLTEIGASKYHIRNKIQRYYSDKGVITLVFIDKKPNKPSDTIQPLILQSKDFGKTFQLLK